MPPDSSVGFAPADWALFVVTDFFLADGLRVPRWAKERFPMSAQRKRTCFCLAVTLV